MALTRVGAKICCDKMNTCSIIKYVVLIAFSEPVVHASILFESNWCGVVFSRGVARQGEDG